LVDYTRIKLIDMIWCDCVEMETSQHIDRTALATRRCAAYMASTNLDVGFDEIKEILVEAGGDLSQSPDIDEHLDNWRHRGGYTKSEYAAVLSRSYGHGKPVP
jgi:hypothetical protein